jgi:hypothetical protein
VGILFPAAATCGMKSTEKKIKKSEKNFVDSNLFCIFVLGKGNNPTTKR